MSFVVGGCSTYSKAAYLDVPHYPSRFLFAQGAYVHGVVEGEGQRTHRYLDFTASLGAVLVGYDSFSYGHLPPLLPGPHDSEEECAALLCEQTGWEAVRWCKNGSDATEAAVRLARFLTGRVDIIVNSYHGSHADLVGATDGKGGGVLAANCSGLVRCTSPLSILDAIATKNVAAVLMEPLTPECRNWRLADIREACSRTGTLLIFDEIITGWRTLPPTVRPDLSCYGKAIGNGMPLACVAGGSEIMRNFRQSVFMSGTHAAETYSLLAGVQTLQHLAAEHSSLPALEKRGEELRRVLEGLVIGYPTRLSLRLPPADHRRFVGRLAELGILVGRDFFLMHAHLSLQREWEQALATIATVREELGL